MVYYMLGNSEVWKCIDFFVMRFFIYSKFMEITCKRNYAHPTPIIKSV